MTARLANLLKEGETEQVEFKSSFNAEAIESLVAFANRKGGTVLVGVNKGRIHGAQLSPESVPQWLNEIKGKTEPALVPDAEIIGSQGKTIVRLDVPEYPIKPVAIQGRYYVRRNNSNHLLSTSEVVNLHLQSINLSWDCYPDPEHTLDRISLGKVQAAIDRINAKEHRISDAPLAFLHKHSLVRDSGQPTFAAFLLFANQPGFSTTVELGRFQDPITIKDSARSQHDLIEQVDALFDFVKKHINKEVIISGKPENTERWQYPLDAVREIILNMIVHRDYRSSADSVIKVFDDRIEFFNPGALPDGLSVEQLLVGDYRSTPRNRAVATLFKELGLIEKYGSGIRRILDLCEAQGLPVPVFENTSQGFVATLYAASKTTQVTTQVTMQVTTQVETLVKALNPGESLSRSELMERLGLANREHFRKAYLEESLKSGALERTIPDKPNSRNQRYRLTIYDGGSPLPKKPGKRT